MDNKKNIKIAVIGLGYVGLPLAVEFGKKFETIGFDINESRINELKNGGDKPVVSKNKLLSDKKIGLLPSSDVKDISLATIYIVTVPTPIDKHKKPDLSYLISASKMKVLKREDIIIYESTVYPGATEEICVPILRKSVWINF